MKRNKVLAGTLCSVVALGSIAPSFANTTGPAVVTTAGGTGTADALLTQEATTFSVGVPTVLPVWVDSEGTVTTATDAQIVNNSFGPVTVEAAQLDPINDWGLVAFDSDVESMKVGSKQFGFELQNAAVPTTGECDVSGFGTIDGNGGAEAIDYDSIVAPQKAAVTEEMANLVFTIGWDELKPTGYQIKSLSDLTESTEDGVDYELNVGDKVQLEAVAIYSAEAATGWSSSNEEVATITEDGLLTANAAGTTTVTYNNNGVEDSLVFKVINLIPEASPAGWFTYSGNTITGLTDEGKQQTEIVIPSEINGTAITSIAQTAMYQSELTSVVIQEGITDIGAGAFASSPLKNIILPDGLKNIGGNAFGSTSIETISIPDSVESMGSAAPPFLNCASLTNIVINEENNYFTFDSESKVLYNKDKTTLIQYLKANTSSRFEIPDGVTTIAQSAFRDGTNLSSITIPDSVTTIEERAFSGTKFTKITIPEGVTSIGDSVFLDCRYLAEITLPSSLTNIGNEAFSNALKLIKIYFRGTKTQWNAISKGTDWDKYTGSNTTSKTYTITYNYVD